MKINIRNQHIVDVKDVCEARELAYSSSQVVKRQSAPKVLQTTYCRCRDTGGQT